MEALARLGINPIYLLSQIIVFSVLAFLLSKFLYNPVLNMLEKRKDRIAKGLEDARAAQEARAKADEAAAEIIEEARRKAQQVIAEASHSADQVRVNIQAQAEEEAKKTVAQAWEDAQLERDKVLSEVRGQIGMLAIAAAQKVVGEALDEERQLALVREFFSGIKAGRVAVLEDARLFGESAVVTSALPLDPEEQASYQSILKARLGPGTDVVFRADPSILGGVIIQVGAQVLDDSLAGKLDELKGRLATG